MVLFLSLAPSPIAKLSGTRKQTTACCALLHGREWVDGTASGCTKLRVGSSSPNTKVVTASFSSADFTCPARVDRSNWLGGHGWGDKFDVSQNGTKVTVKRVDSGKGWGLDLQFKCCTRGPGAFTSWNSGEPNNSNNEDCAKMGSGGKWYDVRCDQQLSFVCQKFSGITASSFAFTTPGLRDYPFAHTSNHAQTGIRWCLHCAPCITPVGPAASTHPRMGWNAR